MFPDLVEGSDDLNGFLWFLLLACGTVASYCVCQVARAIHNGAQNAAPQPVAVMPNPMAQAGVFPAAAGGGGPGSVSSESATESESDGDEEEGTMQQPRRLQGG